MNHNKLGIKDFMKMASDLHSEWSLFAVESSIKDCLDIYDAKVIESDIYVNQQTVEGSIEDKLRGRSFASVIPIVKVRNSTWVIIYSAIYYGNLSSLNDVAMVSRHLSARGVSLAQEDTSESLSYELYNKGEQLEKGEYAYGEENFYWKSKSKKKPRIRFNRENIKDNNEKKVPQIIHSQHNHISTNLNRVHLFNDKSQPISEHKPIILTSTNQHLSNNKSPWVVRDDHFHDDLLAKEEPDSFEILANDNWLIWCEYIDKVFSDLGIYLPAFYPFTDEKMSWIEAECSSKDYIEEVSFIFN
jgi:hypothetical protein